MNRDKEGRGTETCLIYSDYLIYNVATVIPKCAKLKPSTAAERRGQDWYTWGPWRVRNAGQAAIIGAAASPGPGVEEWPEEQGPGSPQARGRGQRPPPWPTSGAQRATWLRGQQPRKGPEARPGEHHFLREGGREGSALQEKPGGTTCPRGGSQAEQAAARET